MKERRSDDELAKSIDALTRIVEKMSPPIPAIPAIPAIPSIPAIIATGDHDLLIKLETKVDGLITSMKDLIAKDNNYVLKEDFTFWRNILVSGMLLSIFIGVILSFIK